MERAVDGPEPLSSLGHRAADRDGVGDVGTQVDGLPAQRLDLRHQGPDALVLRGPAEPHEPGTAGPGEVTADFEPDAAGAADDEVDTAVAQRRHACRPGHRLQAADQAAVTTQRDESVGAVLAADRVGRGDVAGAGVDTGDPPLRILGRDRARQPGQAGGVRVDRLAGQAGHPGHDECERQRSPVRAQVEQAAQQAERLGRRGVVLRWGGRVGRAGEHVHRVVPAGGQLAERQRVVGAEGGGERGVGGAVHGEGPPGRRLAGGRTGRPPGRDVQQVLRRRRHDRPALGRCGAGRHVGAQRHTVEPGPDVTGQVGEDHVEPSAVPAYHVDAGGRRQPVRDEDRLDGERDEHPVGGIDQPGDRLQRPVEQLDVVVGAGGEHAERLTGAQPQLRQHPERRPVAQTGPGESRVQVVDRTADGAAGLD